jgi:hypothetical protein
MDSNMEENDSSQESEATTANGALPIVKVLGERNWF